jgi:hypothetical protein
MMRVFLAGAKRRSPVWIFVLMLLVGAVARGQVVSLLMNDQPAVAGTYKPSDIRSLVTSGTGLSITFALEAD